MTDAAEGVGDVLAHRRGDEAVYITISSGISGTIQAARIAAEELMEACKEFEAYFLEQMFKEMAKTIPDNDNEDATTQRLVDYFKDNAIQEIAAESTESNSLGLAQMLYEQMKRNYGLDATAVKTPEQKEMSAEKATELTDEILPTEKATEIE